MSADFDCWIALHFAGESQARDFYEATACLARRARLGLVATTVWPDAPTIGFVTASVDALGDRLDAVTQQLTERAASAPTSDHHRTPCHRRRRGL